MLLEPKLFPLVPLVVLGSAKVVSQSGDEMQPGRRLRNVPGEQQMPLASKTL